MSNQNNKNEKSQQNGAASGSENQNTTIVTQQQQPSAASIATAQSDATLAKVTDGLSVDEVQQIQLIGVVLGEFGPAAGLHVDMRNPATKNAIAKLHQAFRILFTLRGEAFQAGFTSFVEAINECKTKAYHPKVVNSHLDMINDQSEAGVFVTFINYIIRFARMQNKQKFSVNNDVSRLTDRLTDAELVSALNHAFLVNK